MARPAWWDSACVGLAAADPVMARLIASWPDAELVSRGEPFETLLRAIVGQQISTRAHETIWQRIQAAIGPVTPAVIDALPPETLRNLGLSLRKVGYIRSAARKIIDGEFDIDALRDLPDEEVCARLFARSLCARL